MGLVFGLYGLIVGSFLNVVILRADSAKESAFSGRSHCPHCGKDLAWYDMVPVFSWLALRGKCRYCKASISMQYPLVEGSTAILFALIGGAHLPVVASGIALVVAALLVCMFVYDLRHQLIPDIWVWPFCLLAFAFGFATSYQLPATSYLLAGPVAALPILFLWYLSKPFTGQAGQWMGFGDVKLALGIGYLLGFPLGFIAVFFAFVIGAVVSVCILLPLPYIVRACGIPHKTSSEGFTMKSEVPFGPFLIASTFVCWLAVLYGLSITQLFI